jgi:hypothetical protein
MIEKQFYGDETRWFVGTIVNINDPLQLGRVRVRIFGVHSDRISDIEESDLPWAQTVSPITEGGSSGIGTNLGIKVQAQVYGIFLDGKESQLPLVLGSMPKYERGLSNILISNDPNIPQGSQHPGLVDAKTTAKNKETVSQVDTKYLVGADNVERAFNFFVTDEGGGLTAEQASGIIGNFWVESGAQSVGDLNPTAQSAGSERSFGLAQWNSAQAAGNRYGKLLQFAAGKNLPWQSVYCQLLFTKKELNDKSYYGLNQLKRARSVKDATRIFCDRFENPAFDAIRDDEGKILEFKYDETGKRKLRSHESARIAAAEETFRRFQ